MIDKKILKMITWMMSGLIFCPLITLAQLNTVDINVEVTPFISDVTVECLEEDVILTVHLVNPISPTTYTLINAVPPQTNTTGIFIVPNLGMLQTAIFETTYGNCSDIRQITFACALILPVTIVNIHAQLLSDTEADLIWQVASEINVEHYIVEKSFNGFTFEEIGVVPATTDVSNVKTYNYVDKSLFSGINYFRLRIEDLDGTTYYSKTVSIHNKTGQVTSFKIYPNPTSDNLYVEYTNVNATSLDLKIYNQLGQLMQTSVYSDGLFTKVIQLSVFELTAGIYTIKATDQLGNESISRFFKRN